MKTYSVTVCNKETQLFKSGLLIKYFSTMGSLIMQVLALKYGNKTLWCDCHTKPFQALFLQVVQWSYIYCKSVNEILWSAVLIILPSTIFFFQTDKGMRFFLGTLCCKGSQRGKRVNRSS